SPGYFSSPSGHIGWEITVAEPGQRYRDGSRVRVVEAPGVQSKSKARRLPDGRWIAVGNRPIYTTRGLRTDQGSGPPPAGRLHPVRDRHGVTSRAGPYQHGVLRLEPGVGRGVALGSTSSAFP